MRKRKILFWILGIVITIAAAIYQRLTGPTHPEAVSFQYDKKEYKFELPKSHNGTDNCRIEFEAPEDVNGALYYKRYPIDEKWEVKKLKREDGKLYAYLPGQPPAGKLEYFVDLYSKQGPVKLSEENPLIIRFKGKVPTGILIPHVITMFLAMMFSTIAGLFALGKIKNYQIYGYICLGLLVVGGFIFGPIMQHYAFGDAWTGFPLGKDLTDNKTLIAAIGWIVAIWGDLKNKRPRYYVFAALILLIVYSIPHSLMGSEYNYETGDVTTGIISFF
jgi:hypothetical protein